MLQKRIFQEEWWLSITSQGKYGKLSYESKYGKVHLVYAYRKRYKIFTEIYVAPLSPYSGVYFELKRDINQITKYKLLYEALPILVDQLPKYSRLKVNYSPSFDWWSPLFWKGFSQYTLYTGILKNISDHDAIWKGFNQNIKRNIKKAEKTIIIKEGFDAERLYSLFTKTMSNQGKSPGYPKRILFELIEGIKKRKCGQIFIGEDENGIAHSGILLVWDSTSAYYLIGGTDPELRSSGAMPLTMWTAIKIASNYVDVFDFEGSKQEGIDRFIRSFGAIPSPFYTICNGYMTR